MTQTDPTFHELCFVLMPFGERKDASGRAIQFDKVYEELIRPAIVDAGLDALRGDEELQGGMIHKHIFERLMLCPFAVADLSTANANVFYEVGVRHTARPHATILIHSSESDLKFDVQNLRSMPYSLDAHGQLDRLDRDRKRLTQLLRQAQKPTSDSPLFALFQAAYRAPELPHEVTDTFLERVRYNEGTKRELDALRRRFREAADTRNDSEKAAVQTELRAVEERTSRAGSNDAGTLTALLLSYRACDAYDDMVRLVGRMPEHVASTKIVQEQLGFALNRLKRRREAQDVLLGVLRRFGANPETNGLLGRVHKDLWSDATKAGKGGDAHAHLTAAIETYLRGFEADWRDFYPGVNAVTLMDIAGDPRRDDLLPVVRYATERRIASLADEGQEYWEHATMLELMALSNRPSEAARWRGSARRFAKEHWYLKTTADNLQHIADRRRAAGQVDVATWIEREIAALLDGQ